VRRRAPLARWSRSAKVMLAKRERQVAVGENSPVVSPHICLVPRAGIVEEEQSVRVFLRSFRPTYRAASQRDIPPTFLWTGRRSKAVAWLKRILRTLAENGVSRE